MTLVLTFSVVLNQRLRNPYVDILHIVFFLFYVVRAVVVLMFPLASDLLTPPLATGAVFHATIFLILAFIALVVGCQLFLRRPPSEMRPLNPLEISIVKAALWISAVIVLINAYYYMATFARCNDVYLGIANSMLAILQAVFDSWRTLFFLAPILVLYGGFLSHLERLLAISILVLFGGINIFMGMKSGVLQIILYLLFPLVLRLRSSEGVKLRKLLLPVVLLIVFTVIAFALGKAMRVIQLNGCNSSHSKIEMLVNSVIQQQSTQQSMQESMQRSMEHLSYRTGYFDFFVEKFSNPSYLDVVTFKQYLMAVVDKVTPGFDVFNVPFVSRTIYYAHHPGSVPGQMTNSEQITLFGEAGLLFGWGALLYLPVACWALGLLHRLLHRQSGSSMLAQNISFLFVLQLFYYWIEGMGLDMLFILHLLHSGLFILGIFLLAWGAVTAPRLLTRWQKAK